MPTRGFLKRATDVLDRHPHTNLRKRWEDATSFGEGDNASAFYIRETSATANIVWLAADGIRDITTFVSRDESVFNFTPLSSIVTFEIRSGDDVAQQMQLPEHGDLAVRLILSTTRGQTFWIASGVREEQALRGFLAKVLAAYSRAV